jgi:hypothetical protein
MKRADPTVLENFPGQQAKVEPKFERRGSLEWHSFICTFQLTVVA